jgi:hypothetical protein
VISNEQFHVGEIHNGGGSLLQTGAAASGAAHGTTCGVAAGIVGGSVGCAAVSQRGGHCVAPVSTLGAATSAPAPTALQQFIAKTQLQPQIAKQCLESNGGDLAKAWTDYLALKVRFPPCASLFQPL